MSNIKLKYVWLTIALLLLSIWSDRSDIYAALQTKPAPESLSFNRPAADTEPRPPIVSKDEEINMAVFERARPSVVNIATTTLSMNFWLEVTPREGQGSGFIIDEDGYILTNNHVVAKAKKMTVTMSNGKKIPAELVGRDPPSDLAVIKISAADVNGVATMGDSQKIRVGQKAIAIGNPFGLSHTLTTGIVSAVNREIRTDEGHQIDNLIQTDAAINPGNSGGPLLNSNGEVIGINTAIFSMSGGYQGIGFAIPINLAKYVATELITFGKVARPWLGISGISISPELSDGLRLRVRQGVLVASVIRGSPAHEAGLRGGNREVVIGSLRLPMGGDIIVAIDDREVAGMKQLIKIIDEHRAGQTISLKIIRKERPMELDVLLAESP